MVSTLKKSILLELSNAAGLDANPKARKAELESNLREKLATDPTFAEVDKRFRRFLPGSLREAVRSQSSKPSAASDDTEEAELEPVQREPDASSLEMAASEIELTPAVSSVKKIVPKTPSPDIFTVVRTYVSHIQFLNVVLLGVELVALTYHGRPGLLASFASYSFADILKQYYIWAVTVVVPLALAFFVNFTKQPSIRRKKHEFVVDPVSYGLFRILLATVIRPYWKFPLHHSLDLTLTIVSGVVSSVLGLYAALLQTQ